MSRLTYSLRPVPPFRLDLAVWVLRRRPENLIDRWDGRCYRRALALKGGAVEVAVTQTGPPETPRLWVAVGGERAVPGTRPAVTAALERLLGLRVDLTDFERMAERSGRHCKTWLAQARVVELRIPRLQSWECQQLKDDRMSAKQRIHIRRIILKNGTALSIRPSFLMPDLTARSVDVEPAPFRCKFGVPFWAWARVFGRDPMFDYRLECALGRARIVGTTVKVDLPEHWAADEHHQTRDGEKISIATTAGGGCCLGAEPAAAAGTDDLAMAYGVFREEAGDRAPDSAPVTVNTDGWKGTRAAWKLFFEGVVVLLCFLHGWLKIRDRAKHLGDQFHEIGRRVWWADRAPARRGFAPRLSSLRRWAEKQLSGVVLETVLNLCSKRPRFAIAYGHPGGHRTSNVVDRVLRSMDGYFEAGQHLHGALAASRRHCRAWALLWNFAPWHPWVARRKKAGAARPSDSINIVITSAGCKTCWPPHPSTATETCYPKNSDGKTIPNRDPGSPHESRDRNSRLRCARLLADGSLIYP